MRSEDCGLRAKLTTHKAPQVKGEPSVRKELEGFGERVRNSFDALRGRATGAKGQVLHQSQAKLNPLGRSDLKGLFGILSLPFCVVLDIADGIESIFRPRAKVTYSAQAVDRVETAFRGLGSAMHSGFMAVGAVLLAAVDREAVVLTPEQAEVQKLRRMLQNPDRDLDRVIAHMSRLKSSEFESIAVPLLVEMLESSDEGIAKAALVYLEALEGNVERISTSGQSSRLINALMERGSDLAKTSLDLLLPMGLEPQKFSAKSAKLMNQAQGTLTEELYKRIQSRLEKTKDPVALRELVLELGDQYAVDSRILHALNEALKDLSAADRAVFLQDHRSRTVMKALLSSNRPDFVESAWQFLSEALESHDLGVRGVISALYLDDVPTAARFLVRMKLNKLSDSELAGLGASIPQSTLLSLLSMVPTQVARRMAPEFFKRWHDYAEIYQELVQKGEQRQALLHLISMPYHFIEAGEVGNDIVLPTVVAMLRHSEGVGGAEQLLPLLIQNLMALLDEGYAVLHPGAEAPSRGFASVEGERSAEDLAQVLDRLWCLQDESGPSVLKASIQALLDRDLGAKLMPESESQLEVVIEHLDEANSTALNRVLPEGGVGALTEAQQAAIVSLGPWLSRVHNFSAESWDDLWRQVLGEKPVDLRSILSVGNFELHCYAFQTPMTEAPSLTHLAATVAGAGGVFAHQVARELEDCRDEFLSEMVREVDAGRLINFLPEYVDVAFIEKLCKMALVETDPDLLSVHFASLLRSACPAATALVMQQLRQMSDAQLQRLASGKDAAGVVLALVDMGADGELTRKLATLALGSELTLAKRLHNAAKLCNLSEIVRGAIDFSTVDPNELSKAPLKQRLNLALHLERQQATYLVPSEMRAEWMKVSAEAEELERQGRTVEALFVLVSLRNLIGSHTEEGEYVENELTLPYVFTMLNCCDTSGALPRLASRLTQLPLQSLFQLAKKAEVHIGDQAEASKALLATLSADNKSLLAGVLNVRSEELLWTLSEGKKNREILRNLMRVAPWIAQSSPASMDTRFPVEMWQRFTQGNYEDLERVLESESLIRKAEIFLQTP